MFSSIPRAGCICGSPTTAESGTAPKSFRNPPPATARTNFTSAATSMASIPTLPSACSRGATKATFSDREMDNECGRWENPLDYANSQFVLQPYYIPEPPGALSGPVVYDQCRPVVQLANQLHHLYLQHGRQSRHRGHYQQIGKSRLRIRITSVRDGLDAVQRRVSHGDERHFLGGDRAQRLTIDENIRPL